jgi:uncharacterized protein
MSSRSTPGPARKLPQRTCVACREVEQKRGLIRLVRTADGRVQIDPSGKQAGRGAYLCARPACWNAALKRRALERALRLESLHPDDQQALVHYGQQLAQEQPAV